MIITRLIPVATATVQRLLIEATERTCRTYCVNGKKPSASVLFTTGAPRVVDGVAITPIIATITVVTPNAKGCGCAHTQVFTETFDIAFTATGTNTVTLVPGAVVLVDPADTNCCKARAVKIITTVTATIA